MRRVRCFTAGGWKMCKNRDLLWVERKGAFELNQQRFCCFFLFLLPKFSLFLSRPMGISVLDHWDIYIILNINIQYYFQKINHISNETQEKRVIPLFLVHLCVQIYAEHEFIIVKSQRKMIVWKDFVFIFKKNIWKNSDDSRKFANSIIESSEMQPLPLFCPVTADYLLYHDRILEFLFPLHSCFISSMI